MKQHARLLTLAILLAFAVPGAAAGEIRCTNVSETSTTPFTGASKALKVIKTPFDKLIPSMCSDTGWQTSLDSWHYGEYYPLFAANIGDVKAGSGGTGMKQFIANNAQPKISRHVCWDSGEDDADDLDKSGKNVVGFYAFEVLPSKAKAADVKKSFELHFLCVDQERRNEGLGLRLLNRAFREAGDGMLEDQALYGKIVALETAEKFYNGLTLNCAKEQHGEQTRNLYSRELSIPKDMETWQPLGRKAYVWTDGCEKVDFDCASLSDYDDAKDKGLLFDNDDECRARWEKADKPVRPFSVLLEENQ